MVNLSTIVTAQHTEEGLFAITVFAKMILQIKVTKPVPRQKLSTTGEVKLPAVNTQRRVCGTGGFGRMAQNVKEL